MKLKLDEQGHVVLQDGKPVYLHDDGKEIAFDGAQAFAKIRDLTGEAAKTRKRAEDAEAALQAFEGLDVESARKALDTVKNLDSKQLVAAGEVEKIKTEAIKAVEEKYKPYVSKSEKLEHQITSYMIGGGFKGSKFATEKLTAKGQAGADVAQALFGSRFKVEGDKVVGYDASGNKLYSRSRPGDLADFDEALEMLVDAYPFKDHILSAPAASGSGASQSHAAVGGRKTVTRAQFDQMPQMERASFAKAGGAVVD